MNPNLNPTQNLNPLQLQSLNQKHQAQQRMQKERSMSTANLYVHFVRRRQMAPVQIGGRRGQSLSAALYGLRDKPHDRGFRFRRLLQCLKAGLNARTEHN